MKVKIADSLKSLHYEKLNTIFTRDKIWLTSELAQKSCINNRQSEINKISLNKARILIFSAYCGIFSKFSKL